MSKRGYHHGNLKQALIDVALTLIETKGPTGFTLSKASKTAGVTPAAVYRHFGGREDLIAEAARQGYDMFDELMGLPINQANPQPWLHLGPLDVPIWHSRRNTQGTTSRCLKVAFQSTEQLNCLQPQNVLTTFWKKPLQM